MKILQIIPYFAWAYGGPVRVVYDLAKKLVERGHSVTVYTTDANDEKSSFLDIINKIKNINGIKIKYFKNMSNSVAHKHHLFISPAMILTVRRELRGFDVIHIHDYRTFQNIVVHRYANKYEIPYVIQTHGSVLPFFQKQGLKKIFDLFFGYRILRDASKVIALTNTEAEQYKRMGVDEDKIEIVPNGIDLSEYENLPEKGEFRRKYKIKDNEKIILYVGRLHESKGIDLLVKVFADLTNELKDIKLVLVGPDDGYQLILEELVQSLKMDDKVLFTGFVTKDKKMAAYIDANVFVLPSFLGFPVTFLEACACGTPIITTNNGDTLDWINDKVGYVVEYDKDQLQDAIYKVLSDEGLRRRFGEKGRRLVMEEFGWDKVVEKVESIYSCKSYAE